jgi:hypothetical protein
MKHSIKSSLLTILSVLVLYSCGSKTAKEPTVAPNDQPSPSLGEYVTLKPFIIEEGFRLDSVRPFEDKRYLFHITTVGKSKGDFEFSKIANEWLKKFCAKYATDKVFTALRESKINVTFQFWGKDGFPILSAGCQ